MTNEKKKPKFNIVEFINQMVVTAVVISIATAVNCVVVFTYQSTTNVSGVFLLAVIIVSILTGQYFWGILSAFYCVVATNFFFMYPFFVFTLSLEGYWLTFMIMAATSVITCAMTVNLHNQRDMAKRKEKMAYLMNEMDRKLLRADTKEEIIELLMEHLHIQTERPILYLEHADDEFLVLDEPEISEEGFDLPELSVKIKDVYMPEYYRNTRRALAERRIIKDDLDPVKGDGVLCMPILWQDKVFGAACIVLGEDALTDEIEEYAQAIINHFAIAFDHQALREIQQQILMEKQEEQLRGSLLRSISHDLRTPLTSILGASGSLMENEARMQPELRRKLLKDINEEAHWLLRMIENVLSVTKIGNHNTKLKKMLEPVEEVVADSIARCKKYYPDLKIDIQQPDDLIMVPMDPVLIRQVITNLIDNAHRHGKSNQKIELSVMLLEEWLEVSVQDYGPGMSAEDLQHVFRGLGRRKQREQDSNRGLGLGVSISKTIVEAHDGQLMAENVPGKGLKVTFRLPVGEED